MVPVGLHDAAEEGGLVGDVLQVGFEELLEDRLGTITGELFECIQGPVIKFAVHQFP